MNIFEWGADVERRSEGIPFLCYSPRRTHVCQLLDDARVWVDRVHIVQGDRRLTFEDLFQSIERVASRLRAEGLQQGDRVLLLASNSPEWVITFWATLRAGGIAALGNGWWSPVEMRDAVDVIDPAFVLMDARAERIFGTGVQLRVLHIAEVSEWAGGSDVEPLPAVLPSGNEDAPAVIMFTAGTTAAPKAVVLAHRSVIANIHSLLRMSGRLPQNVDAARGPAVSLQSGPLFHIGGLQSLILALMGGSTLVFLEGRFDAGQVLDLIERERITWWAAVPTMAARVLDYPGLEERDVSTIKSVSMGGAPVTPALLERLRTVFPNAARGLSTVYGMTETGGTVAAANGKTMAQYPSTAGQPLPVVDIRIDGAGADGEGEIVVRTPGQMIGYWGDQGLPDAMDAEGFIHTGDLGKIEDGMLFVTGRIKDLIIRGGENIAPARVEAALLSHPSVANAAVLGLPDGDLGEKVVAVVQTTPGRTVSSGELLAHVVDVLPKPSVPAEWRVTHDPLPVSDTGKVDKRALLATWIAETSPDR